MTITAYDRMTGLIGKKLFNADGKGRTVRLNVTGEFLTEVGYTHETFLAACRDGSSMLPRLRTESITEYAIRLARLDAAGWRRLGWMQDYPLYLGYLVCFAYLTTLDGTDNGYHARLYDAFPVQGKRPTTFYPGFDRVADLLVRLSAWTHNRKGDLGRFSVLRLGRLAHLGLLRSQTILTEFERTVKLPALLHRADMPLDPSDRRLRQVIRGMLPALSLRARTAFENDTLREHLIDDARQALRLPGDVREADGTVVSRRRLTLRLFLDTVGFRRVARLRFEADADLAANVLDLGGSLRATPKPGGLSAPLSDGATPFDASGLDWATDRTWTAGGTRLTLDGNPVRVFRAATGYGVGGLVDVEELPASGECLIAFAPSKAAEMAVWLVGLSPRQDTAGGLPARSRAVRLAVLADAAKRRTFPGAVEEATVRLASGLPVRPGTSEYHTFAPPTVIVHGDDTGIEVYAGDDRLAPLEDGTYVLPLCLTEGEVVLTARRGGEVLDDRRLRLVDNAHAGSPTRARMSVGGWAGAWVDDDALLPYPVEKRTTVGVPFREWYIDPGHDRTARRLRTKTSRDSRHRAVRRNHFLIEETALVG